MFPKRWKFTSACHFRKPEYPQAQKLYQRFAKLINFLPKFSAREIFRFAFSGYNTAATALHRALLAWHQRERVYSASMDRTRDLPWLGFISNDSIACPHALLYRGRTVEAVVNSGVDRIQPQGRRHDSRPGRGVRIKHSPRYTKNKMPCYMPWSSARKLVTFWPAFLNVNR